MVYVCSKCNYTTNRLLNFNRHLNRKRSCNTNLIVESCNVTEPLNNNLESVRKHADPVKVHVDPVKVHAHPSKIEEENESENLKCVKCNRLFTRLDNLKVHMNRCDGSIDRQCPICKKMFTSNQGKWNHMKYVDCKSSQIVCLPTNNQSNVVNADTIETLNSNCKYNNCYNTNNNNITFNKLEVGKEDLTKLWKEKDYMNRNLRELKYAIPRAMIDLYFNDKYPENQTLRKLRSKGNIVEIYRDGKWQKRIFEDVFQPINEQIEHYHHPFFEDFKNKFKDMIQDKKFNKLIRPMKTYVHMMLWYGWDCEFMKDTGIPVNHPEDEAMKNKRRRDMFKLMMETMYDECIKLDTPPQSNITI